MASGASRRSGAVTGASDVTDMTTLPRPRASRVKRGRDASNAMEADGLGNDAAARLALRLEQAEPRGLCHRGGARRYVEFGQDVRHVPVHRVLRDEQLLGHALVA